MVQPESAGGPEAAEQRSAAGAGGPSRGVIEEGEAPLSGAASAPADGGSGAGDLLLQAGTAQAAVLQAAHAFLRGCRQSSPA